MQGLPAAGPEEATQDEEDEPDEAPEEMVRGKDKVMMTMLTWLILSLSSTAGTVLSTAKRCEAAAGTTEGVSGTLRTVECTEEVFVTAVKDSLEMNDDNKSVTCRKSRSHEHLQELHRAGRRVVCTGTVCSLLGPGRRWGTWGQGKGTPSLSGRTGG